MLTKALLLMHSNSNLYRFDQISDEYPLLTIGISNCYVRPTSYLNVLFSYNKVDQSTTVIVDLLIDQSFNHRLHQLIDTAVRINGRIGALSVASRTYRLDPISVIDRIADTIIVRESRRLILSATIDRLDRDNYNVS